MARLRLPLYGKVLLWFLVNLGLLAALGYGFMRMQFRLSLDWMLAGPSGERIEKLADGLSSELGRLPESGWSEVLNRYQAGSGLTLALFGNDGLQKLGQPLEVPREVRAKLINKRIASDLPPPPRADRPARPREPRPRNEAPRKPPFMLRTDHPTLYWAGIEIPLASGEGEARWPLTLTLVSDSLTAGGFLFDPWPWAALAAIALALSALVWLPLVGGITRAIRRLNEAARSVARGGFDVRVPAARHDELGELASSVNAMAQQLGDYVEQQRRITRDVAHELCSPIARMQMALGVVEQRGTPEQAGYLKKLDVELQHMAKLVEEVLAFSKAERLAEGAEPEDVGLADLVQSVVAREAGGFEVRISVPADLHIQTRREALDRALGNVLRNAVRYAGHAGPIEIQATQSNGKTHLRVADEGPGVLPEALPRLFEPFYRPEAARARHTGGSGLGLAIVKRCIEACGGEVCARLRDPRGLEVELTI